MYKVKIKDGRGRVVREDFAPDEMTLDLIKHLVESVARKTGVKLQLEIEEIKK